MFKKPKAFKPADENPILLKEDLLDEISKLEHDRDNEEDLDKKAKLSQQIEEKECELGRIIHKSMKR